MTGPADDPAPLSTRRAVLRHWLGADSSSATCQPATGGFSAAGVWRVNCADREFALRRWPVDTPVVRNRELHRFLQHLATEKLPVAVPQRRLDDGSTLVDHSGHLWQLEAWLPGEPLTPGSLTEGRLWELMPLLARVHLASSKFTCAQAAEEWFAVSMGPAPAIANRLRIIEHWTPGRAAAAAGELSLHRQFPLVPALQEVLSEYIRARAGIQLELESMANEVFPLHPCFRDLWSAHVLFTGDRVSGLIDPAATCTDHPAADLSRLLGSCWGDDHAAWDRALDIYAQVRPLSDRERHLIQVYDRSSVLLSGLNWVERALDNQIPMQQQPAVSLRVERILSRMRLLVRVRSISE